MTSPRTVTTLTTTLIVLGILTAGTAAAWYVLASLADSDGAVAVRRIATCVGILLAGNTVVLVATLGLAAARRSQDPRPVDPSIAGDSLPPQL